MSRSPTGSEPHDRFLAWFEEARAAGVQEPEAAVLATCAAGGRPSARVVLWRGMFEDAYRFFTNYESRKSGELAANPQAALLFYWPTLHRQVRIEGRAVRLPDAESDAYFASRPRGHRIGAWASPQSREITGRSDLERRVAEVEARFPGDPVPRPPFWGGFGLIPDRYEFWTGRENRLHDREVYLLDDEGWHVRRLGP